MSKNKKDVCGDMLFFKVELDGMEEHEKAQMLSEYESFKQSSPEHEYILREMVESLSEEAADVLKTILCCPQEFVDIIRTKKTKAITRRSVIAFVEYKGYPLHKIFSELRRFIQEYFSCKESE